MNTFFAIYASYKNEKRLKIHFIQLETMKLMNLDLKRIFDDLPEGILLINEKDSSVTLVNEEFKRLFKR